MAVLEKVGVTADHTLQDDRESRVLKAGHSFVVGTAVADAIIMAAHGHRAPGAVEPPVASVPLAKPAAASIPAAPPKV